jgi:hypothetical protein
MTAKIYMLSLVLVACGPPRLPFDPQDDESGGGSASSTDSDSSSTSKSSTTSTTDDSSGDAFLPKFDLSTAPPCDPFAQDCPDGEKCVPYSNTGNAYDANKCVPVMGDQTHGEPCSYDGAAAGTDDCDEMSGCSNVHEVDGELIGICHAFCMGTADDPECPPDTSCSICSDGCPNYCIFSCDPVAQDCDLGVGCYWAYDNFSCLWTTQYIPEGQPCGQINDCMPGLVCLTAEVIPACDGAACCGKWCNHDLGDAQCETTPGTVCELFFEQGMAPPGDEHIGVCIIPGA